MIAIMKYFKSLYEVSIPKMTWRKNYQSPKPRVSSTVLVQNSLGTELTTRIKNTVLFLASIDAWTIFETFLAVHSRNIMILLLKYRTQNTESMANARTGTGDKHSSYPANGENENFLDVKSRESVEDCVLAGYPHL